MGRTRSAELPLPQLSSAPSRARRDNQAMVNPGLMTADLGLRIFNTVGTVFLTFSELFRCNAGALTTAPAAPQENCQSAPKQADSFPPLQPPRIQTYPPPSHPLPRPV